MRVKAIIAIVVWSLFLFVATYIVVTRVFEPGRELPSISEVDPGPAVYQPVPFPIDTYPFCMGRESCKTIVPKPADYQRWSLTEGTWVPSYDKVVR